MNSREEHLAFCKKRAMEYVDSNDYTNAVTSMLSDLSKHPETRGVGEKMATLGMFILMSAPAKSDVERFIQGFN